MTLDETRTREQNTTGFASIGSKYYAVLVGAFTGLLLISNITATKGIAFGPIIGNWSIVTDGGFILFPLTYVIGDVLSEVYGFRATRRAIYVGFTMQAIAALAFWITIYMPAVQNYTNQAALRSVVGASTQLIIAGLAGFVCGQTLNSWVVVKVKARTQEKHLWFRLVGSTVVGELADTVVFCSIAAPAIGITTVRDFVSYVILGWVYKTLVEVIVLPITYRVIAYIKRREPTYVSAGR